MIGAMFQTATSRSRCADSDELIGDSVRDSLQVVSLPDLPAIEKFQQSIAVHLDPISPATDGPVQAMRFLETQALPVLTRSELIGNRLMSGDATGGAVPGELPCDKQFAGLRSSNVSQSCRVALLCGSAVGRAF